jgi:hypothetical protein
MAKTKWETEWQTGRVNARRLRNMSSSSKGDNLRPSIEETIAREERDILISLSTSSLIGKISRIYSVSIAV